MLLSIIVPVYNVENYLERCIDSLLDQGDFNDYEIILVDDGSKDSSGTICDSYAKNQDIIRVIHKVNGGLSSARNAGIKESKGKYIMFIDSDDYIKSNSLSMLFACIKAYSLDVLSFNYLYSYADGKKEINSVITIDQYPITGEDFLQKNLQNNTMQMIVVKNIYLSALILDNDVFFREGYVHEDEHWVPRALIKAQRIMQIPDVIYAYCIRESSISRNQKSKVKGANDLISNCFSLYDFVVQVHSRDLRCLLENNICTLTLSASYSGRLTERYKEISQFLSGLHVDKRNNLKRALFVSCPKFYYFLNSFIKRVSELAGVFHKISAKVNKFYQYSNQQFHKYIRKIRFTDKQKKQLQNHSFSIISSNCNGAVITSELGEQFRTPTVNLFFTPPDYVKFASDLKYYLSCDLIEVKNNMESYPVGKLDDIIIYFMYYKSFEEARKKWNSRKQRVNFDNLFFMLSEHNGCTKEDINAFLELPYNNKIIFTNNESNRNRESFVFVEEDKDKKEVGIMTDFVSPFGARKYDKYFDYVKWLNEGENS